MSVNIIIREILQGVAWVAKVDDRYLGKFLVAYAENPMCIANSTTQKEEMELIGLAWGPTTVNYRKSGNLITAIMKNGDPAVPILVHSMNSVGARMMSMQLDEAGYSVTRIQGRKLD